MYVCCMPVSQDQHADRLCCSEEEVSFNRTLDKGIKRFKGAAADAKKQGQKDIDSKVAFEMWDTYGFPIDLTQVSDELRNGMSTKKVLIGTTSQRSTIP